MQHGASERPQPRVSEATAFAAKRPPASAFTWAPLVVGAAGLAVLVFLVRGFVTDDAYISARYARNLALGLGPVWNPGGPAVEGYGNPLLVLLEAAVYRLGADGLVAARAMGVAGAFGVVAAVFRLGRAPFGACAASAAAMLVGLTPAMAFWAVGGLETTSAVLSVTVASLSLARDEPRRRLAGAVLCPLPWLRPEGAAVAVTLALASEARGLIGRAERRRALRHAAVIGLPAVVSAGLVLALRLHWFGTLVPNSAIYKLVADAPGSVTLRFLGQAAPLLPLAVLGLSRLRGREWVIAAPMVLYLAGSLTTINSVNAFSRFMLPTWPLWVLASVLAIARTSPPPRRLVAIGSVAVLAAIGVSTQTGSAIVVSEYARHYAGCKTEVRRAAAGWLAARVPADRLFAIGDAGLVPFLVAHPAFDLFSLNDPVLQRTGRPSPAARADQTLEAAPEIVFTSARSPDLEPQYPVERALVGHPRFAGEYEPAAVLSRPACDYHLRAWQRRRPAPMAKASP